MATRLTPFSKLLITLIIVAAIVLGGKWLLDNTDIGASLKDQANQGGSETPTAPDSRNGGDVPDGDGRTPKREEADQHENEFFQCSKGSKKATKPSWSQSDKNQSN